jgi:hypothetical protein
LIGILNTKYRALNVSKKFKIQITNYSKQWLTIPKNREGENEGNQMSLYFIILIAISQNGLKKACYDEKH